MIFTTWKNKTFQRACAILFWLIIWQFAAQMVGQELFLASPIKVLRTLSELVCESSFYQTLWFSFVRIVSGFLLALVFGVLLGVGAAKFDGLQTLLAPFIGVLKAIPVASFVILALLWVGSRNLSTIISFLMVFPVIYANVVKGVLSVDHKLLEMAVVFRISLFRRIVFVYFPAVMPFFTTACTVALGLCWKSGVAAEVIGIPSGSIGERLYMAKIYLSSGELFAWTIVVILLSTAFERIFLTVLRWFNRRLEHIL